MIKIKQITTVEQLYKTNGALTGNILVDAIVENVKRTRTHECQDISSLLDDIDVRFLSKAMEIFVGVPLKEFIRQWRVYQAVDLLDNEELSIDEVANRVGFSRSKNLDIAMKRYFGTTPGIYRSGSINMNGTYPLNIDKGLLKEAQENARKLHNRDWKQTPAK